LTSNLWFLHILAVAGGFPPPSNADPGPAVLPFLFVNCFFDFFFCGQDQVAPTLGVTGLFFLSLCTTDVLFLCGFGTPSYISFCSFFFFVRVFSPPFPETVGVLRLLIAGRYLLFFLFQESPISLPDSFFWLTSYHPPAAFFSLLALAPM